MVLVPHAVRDGEKDLMYDQKIRVTSTASIHEQSTMNSGGFQNNTTIKLLITKL